MRVVEAQDLVADRLDFLELLALEQLGGLPELVVDRALDAAALGVHLLALDRLDLLEAAGVALAVGCLLRGLRLRRGRRLTCASLKSASTVGFVRRMISTFSKFSIAAA